jgi:hypothetical protein
MLDLEGVQDKLSLCCHAAPAAPFLGLSGASTDDLPLLIQPPSFENTVSSYYKILLPDFNV